MRRATASVAVLAVLAALAVAGFTTALAASGPDSTSSHDATVRISVAATEFAFKLSRSSVPVGTTVVFAVSNQGKIAHNFSIAGKTSALVQAGSSTTLSVTFTKAGSFKYLCTITGHAAAGMLGTFSVTGAGARTTVTVKGSDSAVRISPRTFGAGAVVFKVTNSGKATHVFRVESKRTTVKPHRTSTLMATLKAGKVAWKWTGGPKSFSGKLTVKGGGGTTSTATTTTAKTTTAATTTTPVSCTNVSTTVNVGMFEYRFEFDKASVPAGCIQFVITNKGTVQHNFDITGAKAGAILAPGQSETWAVQLAAKTYNVVCDVPFHIDYGMTAQFTVT